MTFEVSLQKFSGPLQLLLDLIEQEELPITEVSLAKVTEDYLKHIEEHSVPPEELADFLIVATRLLLIKSKAILPSLVLEEEDEGTDLALQLKMYKEFVEASENIQNLYEASQEMFGRVRVSIPKAQGFFPPENVTQAIMHETFIKILKRLEPFFALQNAALERAISVKERISEIRDVILQRSKMLFTDIVKGSKTKVDVVVSFLALLELVKQNVVDAVQGDAFNDIQIKHID